jgi:hypothetical protein
MRKILYIGILISALALSYSCQKADDFLDKKPLGEYSEVDVWSDLYLIETFVNGMYKNAMGWPFAIERLSDYADESHFTPDWGVTNFNKSLMTQDDLQGWAWNWATPNMYMHLRWDPLYLNVRRCNIFFQKIDEAKIAAPSDQELKDRLTGEAFFLRALTYHKLVCLFGGVPIITKAYGLTDVLTVPRNTYEECISFIVGQLDSAAVLLPLTMSEANDNGRVTKGAALALKARVLLFAASDLHHTMSTYAPGYANPELLGYTGGSQLTRWQAAKDAAQDVIDLGIYNLYKKDPGATDSIAQNFVDYFTSDKTEEDILLQYFSTKSTSEGWAYYNPAQYCGPNGYHNWGNNCPLGDLVDDYEMRDGSKFDWNDPVRQINPYANRDQRLYATILYEGTPWRTRPPDALLVDALSKIQVGYVYNIADTTVPIKAGLDTRQGQFENWNGGYTGYYVRKFVDPTLDPQYVAQEVPFRHIRYAEVLLNFAEASIELGEDGPARDAINLIRKRAGQPDITESGDALRQRYRHERRIELAYEDHRFWDVRRWAIGADAYHQTHAVSVKYFTEITSNDADLTRFFIPPANYTGTRPADKYRQTDGTTWGPPVYTCRDNPAGDQRTWLDKCYFFPIMRDEMGRNPELIQNPGY